MRFSVVAAALMATFAAADFTSTTSTTVIETISSCAPEVTNCPYRTKTSTSTPIYANTTSTTAPYVVPTTSQTVTLATTYITTCIPTTVVSVFTVTPSAKPSSTGTISVAKNLTAPAATSTPTQFVGAGSSVQGSVLLVAAAGVAAFLFA